MAIKIAKHFGAYVAIPTSAQSIDLVRKPGADQVIDYQAEKFEEMLSGFDLSAAQATFGYIQTGRAKGKIGLEIK